MKALAVDRAEVTAFVALGANLGHAAQALRDALTALGDTPGVRLVQASRLYRTAPVQSTGPDYVNAESNPQKKKNLKSKNLCILSLRFSD